MPRLQRKHTPPARARGKLCADPPLLPPFRPQSKFIPFDWVAKAGNKLIRSAKAPASTKPYMVIGEQNAEPRLARPAWNRLTAAALTRPGSQSLAPTAQRAAS